VEKSKSYIVDYYRTSTYKVGTFIKATPTYFISDEKPFFTGYNGNTMGSSCVEEDYNTNIFRIYEGRLKNIFSKKSQSLGDMYKSKFDIDYEESKNGILIITGHIESHEHDTNNESCDFSNCDSCEGDLVTKTDIYERYQWNEANQEFDKIK